jgi:5'-3' exonuclease
MGVPGLWPFIKDKFPHAIKHFRYGQTSHTFDYVYLDANGLLHSAAQTVENYGEKKRRMNPYSKLSLKERRTKIFELFFDNILEVTGTIRARKVLYIAIDGPAPRAKQNQQRERRFIASMMRKIEEEVSGEERFDSSSISPGTEFMHELSKFMYWKIRDYMQTRGDWRGIKVIYSPPTVAGEGEHKVMDYIRTLSVEERNKASHCMFGPDGDLMMLTLSAHVHNMNLFREDQYEPGWVDLVNMSMVRRGLSMQLGQYEEIKKGKRTEHDVSDDFVFIGFFVGNDFLPKIKMFYRLKDGLQKMFEVYEETSSQCATLDEQCYLTTNGRLNIEALGRFVSRLSDFEEQYIASQATITAIDPRFVDHTLLKYSEVTRNGNQDAIIKEIDMVNYRIAYYERAGITSESGIKTICRDYLRNLIWVYKYYSDELPSWGEAYEWHYAPLMLDFAKYIEKLSQEDIDEISTFDKQQPALPFEQLLSILSSKSAKLLPEEYRGLMTDLNSILVKEGYYPETFEIDYEGKSKEFQGVAKLPFVKYDVVSNAYKEVATKSKYEYYKNSVGKVSMFEYKEKGFLADFTSDYGNVVDCQIKVKKL